MARDTSIQKPAMGHNEDSITVCYSTCSKCIDDIIRNKVVKNLSIF